MNVSIHKPTAWQLWRKRDDNQLVKIILIANYNFDELVVFAPAKGIHDPTAMSMGLFLTYFERAQR